MSTTISGTKLLSHPQVLSDRLLARERGGQGKADPAMVKAVEAALRAAKARAQAPTAKPTLEDHLIGALRTVAGRNGSQQTKPPAPPPGQPAESRRIADIAQQALRTAQAAEVAAARPGKPAARPIEPAGLVTADHVAQTTDRSAGRQAEASSRSAPQAAAAPPATHSYVGEQTVSKKWLQRRETALDDVTRDFMAQMEVAHAHPGGPGWVRIPKGSKNHTGAVWITEGKGSPPTGKSAAGSDPDRIYRHIGGRNGHTVYGHYVRFSPEAYAAAYKKQAGQPLQKLADLYGTDAKTLLKQHPEIWALATQEHALRDGPPPPGKSMLDAGMAHEIDAFLNSDSAAALIQRYGKAPVPPPGSAAQRELARVYGTERYEQMSRYTQAVEVVRDKFLRAFADAASGKSELGWKTQIVTRWVSDPNSDGASHPVKVTERVFDPELFVRRYVKQDGLQYSAFAELFGKKATARYGVDGGDNGTGQTYLDTLSLESGWTLDVRSGRFSHKDWVILGPKDTPDLHDDTAVYRHPLYGWVTPSGNIEQHEDWLDKAFPFVVVVGLGVAGGFAGGALAEYFGLTAAGGGLSAGGAVVAGAVAGGTSAAANGIVNGGFSWKSVLTSAFSGALSGGLSQQFGAYVANNFGPLGTLAFKSTVQGGIQLLLGGKFKDGALAGFASGLADLIKTDLSKQALGKSWDEQVAIKYAGKVLGSLVQAAADPSDPEHAFAKTFLGDVLSELAPEKEPGYTPLVDDEGNLMPGAVDANATWEDQAAQLKAKLLAQGMLADTADAIVSGFLKGLQDGFTDKFINAQGEPVRFAGGDGSADVRVARQLIDDIESRIERGSLKGAQIGQAINDSYDAYLQLAGGLEHAGLTPTVQDERAAQRLIGLISDLGQLAQQQGVALGAEQQNLVRLSQGWQWARNAPEIYGAAVGGGILAVRGQLRSSVIEAWERNPALRHPDQIIGRTDGGPGKWVYSGQRNGGAAYQEQVSGVPRGMEYEVNGVKLDAYDTSRRVAIDAKDWNGYPPPGTRFWQSDVVKQATDQLDALQGTGVKLEWHVSTPQAANAIREAFRAVEDDSAQRALSAIKIVVVPKK